MKPIASTSSTPPDAVQPINPVPHADNQSSPTPQEARDAPPARNVKEALSYLGMLSPEDRGRYVCAEEEPEKGGGGPSR